MGQGPARPAAAPLLALLVLAAGDEACWGGGMTREHCCNPAHGPQGNPACWDSVFTFQRCCAGAAAAVPQGPPPPPIAAGTAEGGFSACTVPDVVLRHSGEHALFADMSFYGHSGCFLGDCKKTDKFHAEDPGVCARCCADLGECTHWTFGRQDGASTCFLRKSDGGRERGAGWASGTRACAPRQLPSAFIALAVAESEGVKGCDKGKSSETCPDVIAAITTWQYAIKHLKLAIRGADEGTRGTVNQLMVEMDNLLNNLEGEWRPSDADFPRIVYNNRHVTNALRGHLQQAKMELSAAERASLPNPLRTGTLCGRTSCYER